VGTPVTVAIPTLNAGSQFAATLAMVRAQRCDHEVELLVCDSGSSDETLEIARAHGATVIEITREQFSHGTTRNLMMQKARGGHVAFLTQDAEPAGRGWLAQLLEGFMAAPDVGLVFGPYLPRDDASPWVARELSAWFHSFTNGSGQPRVDSLAPDARDQPARAFLGHVGFFSDANGCVARPAWERVPFRPVDYAEDHLLAQEMLRAGFAKVYVPAAAVIHSHEYSPWEWLRRSFDEARAVRQIYGLVPGASAAEALRAIRGGVSADRRWLLDGSAGAPGRRELLVALLGSAIHHLARGAGTVLGANATRLPAPLSSKLSLEGRR
jgi:glycosyltransferase involved in cell wall biosynthesis